MLSLVKEKSWSIKLVDGFVLDGRVRTKNCEDCMYTSKLIVNNYNDPNLVLFGCSGHKCKQRLIRLRVVQ